MNVANELSYTHRTYPGGRESQSLVTLWRTVQYLRVNSERKMKPENYCFDCRNTKHEMTDDQKILVESVHVALEQNTEAKVKKKK